MRVFLSILALAVVAACGPRQVDVSTGASTSTQSQPSLTVTNNYTQPVQVYVVQGGNPMFLREVAARATQTMSVPGIATGSSVTLRATRPDGTNTERTITLSSSYNWTIP